MNRLFALGGSLTALAAGFGLLARYVSPHVFWPPAIVALFLPVLLIGTLVYVLLQLWRRRWRAVVFPVFILLCSVPILGRLFAWPSAVEKNPEGQPVLQLLTGNQRFFRSADQTDADTSRVGSTFRQYGVQAALLQEIRTVKYPTNYIAEVNSAAHLGERHQRRGTLIATYGERLTPVSETFLEPNEYNGFIVTDMDSPLGPVRLINTHMKTNEISDLANEIGSEGSTLGPLTTFGRMLSGYGHAARVRARQAEDIRRAVEESPHPVIVGGDFNDVPSSYTYQRMLTPRLRDAWAVRGSGLGATFTGPLPGLRIDYFLVDTSLTVVDIERLPSAWSDHRPLRLTVTR